MRYNLVSLGDHKNLTAFVDGEPVQCDNSHPYWDEIIMAVVNDEPDEILDLIDMAKAAESRFDKVTDRVAVRNGSVYFDGDEVNNALASAIVRALREGADFRALARFMEKIYQNPNKHSRENLYDWLNAHDFTINSEGNLLGYKGVNTDLGSINHGPGIVDGQPMNGSLPNQPGSILEMARSAVQHDPSVGCSSGLHVGTWDYAASFGSIVLQVEVNPRDVVSVPTDCGWAKMRVSRYRVIDVLSGPMTSLVVDNEYDTWDE